MRTIKVSPQKAAKVEAQLGHKKRPRGRAFPKGKANKWAFPKGQSGHPGGKPKVLVKFKAKIAEAMLQPCPPLVKKALGLRRNASVYDAMVQSLVLSAASGDSQAFMHCHDIIDGPIIQKRFNVTASMERFLADEKFRAFLEEQHSEYLSKIGVTENGNGQRVGGTTVPSLSRLFGAEGSEGASETDGDPE